MQNKLECCSSFFHTFLKIPKKGQKFQYRNKIPKSECTTTGGVTDGAQGNEPSPWQAKCKNRPLLLTFWYLVFFNLLFLCVFRDVFVFLSSMDIHDIQRFTIISSTFSEFWIMGPLRWPVGPLQLSFAPSRFKRLVVPWVKDARPPIHFWLL